MTLPTVGARVLRGTELLTAGSATAEIARAVLDATADAGLTRERTDQAPADVVILVVPAGKGNGALNVALRSVELDLAGDGAELERRLYA